MIIMIEDQTNGPYQSVEQMLDACGSLELPTSRFYAEQEKVSIEAAQGVRIVINEHFGPVLWLYPPKDYPDFDPTIIVTVTHNDQALTFPRNNADCYGIREKDVIEIGSTHKHEIHSNKFIFSKLQKTKLTIDSQP